MTSSDDFWTRGYCNVDWTRVGDTAQDIPRFVLSGFLRCSTILAASCWSGRDSHTSFVPWVERSVSQSNWRWCHYSVVITSCNQDWLQNGMLSQETCLLPLKKKRLITPAGKVISQGHIIRSSKRNTALSWQPPRHHRGSFLSFITFTHPFSDTCCITSMWGNFS